MTLSRQRRRFPNRPDSVPAARYFVRGTLVESPPAVASAVELMVSELATNCVRHTDTSFELAISQDPAEIRVEVSDSGAGALKVGTPKPSDLSGRGLPLVDMMADRWGIETAAPGAGKTVWFTVSAAA